MTFIIRPLGGDDLEWLNAQMDERWGGRLQAVNGELYPQADHAGSVAVHDGERVGFVTYSITGDTCVIGILESLREREGIGTALVGSVLDTARDLGCARVRVVTTNDALRAQRLYERLGFEVLEVRHGAVDESRELKPTIPVIGEGGTAITDEIEYELRW